MLPFQIWVQALLITYVLSYCDSINLSFFSKSSLFCLWSWTIPPHFIWKMPLNMNTRSPTIPTTSPFTSTKVSMPSNTLNLHFTYCSTLSPMSISSTQQWNLIAPIVIQQKQNPIVQYRTIVQNRITIVQNRITMVQNRITTTRPTVCSCILRSSSCMLNLFFENAYTICYSGNDGVIHSCHT
jgi:hypothetical protein